MSEAMSFPHDLDAERSVLGAILIDPPMLVTAQDAIAPKHFYRQAHRVMFEALQALAEAKQALDHVTLAGYLRDRGQLDLAGGPAYIGSLSDGVPRATNVEYYAGIVRDKAIRRDLLRAAQGLLDASQSPASVPDVIDAGIQSLVELSGSASPGDQDADIDQLDAMARVFGHTLNELIDLRPDPKERDLVEAFRALRPEARDLAVKVLDAMIPPVARGKSRARNGER